MNISNLAASPFVPRPVRDYIRQKETEWDFQARARHPNRFLPRDMDYTDSQITDFKAANQQNAAAAKKDTKRTAFRVGVAVAGVFTLHILGSTPATALTLAALGSLVSVPAVMIGTSIWLINYSVVPAAFATLKLALSIIPLGIGVAVLVARAYYKDLPPHLEIPALVAAILFLRIGLPVAITGIGSAVASVTSVTMASLATRLTGAVAGYFAQEYYLKVPFARLIGIGERVFDKLA